MGYVACGRAVIQHRVREYLTGECDLAAVASEQGEGCGEPASGALADHGDAVWVDVGLRGEPLQCCVAVVERGRVGVFGRHAVVDARGDRSEFVGQAPAERVALGGRADDEAAAVQVEDGRAARAHIRRVGADRPLNAHGDAVAQFGQLAVGGWPGATDARHRSQQPAVAPRGRGGRHEPCACEVGVKGGGVVIDHAPTLGLCSRVALATPDSCR